MKNMKNFLPLDELKKVQQYSKDNNVVVVTASQRPLNRGIVKQPYVITYQEALRRIKALKLKNKLKKIKI